MEKNEIYGITGTAYLEMTMELLRKVDLAGEIGNRHKRVGIKPNLVVPKTADTGATTHPELVEGVIRYLKQEGFDNLVVLEGSWVGDRTSEAVRVNGLLEVCKRQEVPFLDLQKDETVRVQGAGMDLQICKETAALDYLINIPVLKGHCQTIITCALKNAKGLIPNSEKRRFHTLGLHKPIAHLNAAIHQDFILVDNICGDLDFEEGGNPVVMNRILACKDPVLCDSFAAESMGYRPEEIPYIAIASKIGVGSSDTSKAKLIWIGQETSGEEGSVKGQSPLGGMDSVKGQSPLGGMDSVEGHSPLGGMGHHSRRVEQLAEYVEPKDACSACYGSLIYALDRLKDEGLLSPQKKGTIAIGQGYRNREGELGIGQCTSCFERSLRGCPPKAVDIAAFLRREWSREDTNE